MTLKIVFENKFKKDLKMAYKRGKSREKLLTVLDILSKQSSLPEKYKDHALADSRSYKNARECHIEPDWLLVYRIEKDNLILVCVRTGTHSDLF